MIVVWTANAKRELRAAYDTVADTSIRYAESLVDRITRRTADLSRFHYLGAEVSEYSDPLLREVFEHPYRIIYRVRTDRIEILSVVHSARKLPSTPPG
jgi:plasmid stabilization system protein ParE